MYFSLAIKRITSKKLKCDREWIPRTQDISWDSQQCLAASGLSKPLLTEIVCPALCQFHAFLSPCPLFIHTHVHTCSSQATGSGINILFFNSKRLGESVSWGCYNKWPQTGVGERELNNRNVFSHSSETGSTRSKCPTVAFWWDLSPWLADGTSSLIWPSLGTSMQRAPSFSSSSYKATNFIEL